MGAALDAHTLREAMARYAEALEAHREEIDSLNVFPVPDGDTGTNLLLTQRAVAEALGDASSMRELGDAISRAALMGARGNSGVILSQILRGLCHRLCGLDRPGGRDLAEALLRADTEAHAAVASPVEGTILSVLRDAARAAEAAAERDQDPAAVAQEALDAATGSLARTTEQLPELARAGVVDAGGKGLVLLLDALVSALRDVPLSVAVGPLGPVGRAPEGTPPASRYGFEVMYLLEAPEDAVGPLRDRLAELGDSVVVVGGGGMYHVHVHTDVPGAAVEAGLVPGRPSGIRIASLDEAVAERCLADQGRATRPGGAETGTRTMLAVCEGTGLAEIFRSIGASVVTGGPGNNPAVGELVAAIETAPGEHVYLLPNHRNVWPAAEAAAREASRRVEVVPTRSPPEGLAAALAFDPGDGPDAMRAAARACASGALARADKEARTRAGPVVPGSWVGLDFEGDEIRAVGADPASVAADLLGRLAGEHHEIATLYVGADADEEEAGRVVAALREARPALELETHRGGQPRYPYLIGLE